MRITERGWIGHYICGDKCRFRRNTLIECNGVSVVVSTVGLQFDQETRDFDKFCNGSYFETKAFHVKEDDPRFRDADIGKEISFGAKNYIDFADADDIANANHDIIVEEIKQELLNGNIYPITEEKEKK